jgi:uncharacterized protein (UPF0335 family)
MVTIIKKDDSKETIEKSLKNTGSGRGFDSKKHLNVIKLEKKPTEIQKRLRNEWQ